MLPNLMQLSKFFWKTGEIPNECGKPALTLVKISGNF
jgi:hypothetical protein